MTITVKTITVKTITDTYARLRFWIDEATIARQSLTETQYKIKEADAQVWPGSNEAERKAAKLTATAELRQKEQEQAAHLARTEMEVQMARLALDEIHDLMRLMEFEK